MVPPAAELALGISYALQVAAFLSVAFGCTRASVRLLGPAGSLRMRAVGLVGGLIVVPWLGLAIAVAISVLAPCPRAAAGSVITC